MRQDIGSGWTEVPTITLASTLILCFMNTTSLPTGLTGIRRRRIARNTGCLPQTTLSTNTFVKENLKWLRLRGVQQACKCYLHQRYPKTNRAHQDKRVDPGPASATTYVSPLSKYNYDIGLLQGRREPGLGGTLNVQGTFAYFCSAPAFGRNRNNALLPATAPSLAVLRWRFWRNA